MRHSLFVLFAFIFAAMPMAVESANPYGGFGQWSMYRGKTNKGFECWNTTASSQQGRNRTILLYVSKPPGKPTEISVVVPKAVQNVRNIFLTIESKRFRLFRQGNAAWPKASDDKAIIKALQNADKSGAVNVSLQWGSRINWVINPNGFSKAYKKNIPNCPN